MLKDCSKCCEPKKKIFQGKVYIPDDHIQLISKYFQGANLNLNFAVDDDKSCSDKDCFKKKRKTRSRSRKRCPKKRRRKSKRCKCCKCLEEKCEDPKSCCCGTPVNNCPPKPKKPSCCDKIDPCAPALINRCCGGETGQPMKPDCCEAKSDPYGAQCCCEGKARPAIAKPSICCCENPVEPEPEKICCCCGRPCVEKIDEMKESAKSKTENGKTKEKTKSKLAEDGNHQHTSCCCKCRDQGNKEANSDENRKEISKNEKKKSHKKGSKNPSRPKLSDSSDSIKSNSSNGSGKNVKQVYVTKKVSSLENDDVYGRYWYHRPPLENTITHCDDDDYPGPSGYRNKQRPCEHGGPCDGRTYPPNSAYAHSALQHSETGDRFRRGAGRCMACKEPMCLLCKMNICDCDCEKPNFVICNPCKHRLTPKPPKKPCPPKKPKPKHQPQHTNGGCDEALFLLPLLAAMQASMQGNNNFQQCNS